MAAFKAVLADEQKLFMEGIKRIIPQINTPDLEVIATVQTGKDLLKNIETNDVDLIIFELSFADVDHEELILKLKSLKPQVKLFVLSAYGDVKLVRSCFNRGIDGYMLKASGVEVFQQGLKDVFQDKIFMGEGIQLAPDLNEKESKIPGKNSQVNDRFLLKQKLTKRELQILQMIVSGMNNRQISKELYISHETVGVHKKNIKKKLEMSSTPALIEFVLENKILS